MKKYSVLMSLYYKEKPEYLRQSLDSMIKQTVRPDEIVMVYDGPLTDDLYEVMNEYIKQYPKLFNIVKNETNLGLGLSLNKGLLACKNELVARMDTDDISVHNRAEQQLSYFDDHPESDVLGGNISEFIDVENNVVCNREVPVNSEKIKKFIKKRCPFNHMTVMYKRSSVLRAGNYQDWFWNEDYFLWIRMYQHHMNFANTGTILVNVRVGMEMYQRRGGLNYFKSEKKLQDYMLKNNLIGFVRYADNIIKRLIIQLLLPNEMRSIIFRKLARNKVTK